MGVITKFLLNANKPKRLSEVYEKFTKGYPCKKVYCPTQKHTQSKLQVPFISLL